MATRSEQFHADEQRTSAKSHRRAGRTKPGVAPKNRSRAKDHAAKKATYALETTEGDKRPSRKSTRKSANRAKSDSSFNAVEELRKGSPESRFRKDRARAARARGAGRA
jgi:hypothetical protein